MMSDLADTSFVAPEDQSLWEAGQPAPYTPQMLPDYEVERAFQLSAPPFRPEAPTFSSFLPPFNWTSSNLQENTPDLPDGFHPPAPLGQPDSNKPPAPEPAASPFPNSMAPAFGSINDLFLDTGLLDDQIHNPALQGTLQYDPDPQGSLRRFANMGFLQENTPLAIDSTTYPLARQLYAQQHFNSPDLSDDEFFRHVSDELRQRQSVQDALQKAYQDAREQTWSRAVEQNSGSPVPFSQDHFQKWSGAHAEAFSGQDNYATFHNYINAVSAASDEASPLVGQVRRMADLIHANTSGISTLSQGSLDEGSDILAKIPASQRPLAFGMLKAYNREHGIDDKKFLTMLAEVPLRTGISALNGLGLVPYETRLRRDLVMLRHGLGRLLKGGSADLASLHLPEDDQASPLDPSASYPQSPGDSARGLVNYFQTREITDSERDALIAQAERELARTQAYFQLKGYLEHEYDPVKPTVGGVGGLFQRLAYFGAEVGRYAAVSAIPEGGPLAAGMGFIGSSVDDIRTQYPDLSPEDAATLGTSIALAQMLILGGMGRVVKGDLRGATAWLRGVDASRPLLTQTALRLAAESSVKGAKLTGLMAASTAIPLATKLLAEQGGMTIPGFDPSQEWQSLTHPQPETYGILALLWLTGVGVSASRYARVAELAKQYGFSTEDAARFASASNLSQRLDAFEQGIANMTPEARQALAQAVDKGVFQMKQATGAVSSNPDALREQETVVRAKQNSEIAKQPQVKEIKVTPNEHGRDTEELQRLARESRGAFTALESVYHGEPGAREVSRQREIYGAEIAAAATGRKPLFHEQLGEELARPIAAKLRKILPPEVTVAERDGHLYVFRPDVVGKSLDEIHALTQAGDNGPILGYGRSYLGQPGTVLVTIDDSNGHPLGGFNAFPDEVERFGRQRAQDYSDALGAPTQLTIAERSPNFSKDTDQTGNSKAGGSSPNNQPQLSLKERVEKDLDGAARVFLEKYARETPDGPLIIAPDRVREMDPAYRLDPIGQNAAVHEPSVKVANRAFEIALESAPPGDVVFLAGAPGVGKTQSLSEGSEAAIIVDRTLANYKDAESQIQAALDAGREVRVNYIYRPLGETVLITLERALKEKSAGGGRPVPVTAVASAYEKSRLNVIKLRQHFGNKINFLLIDMTGNAFRKMEPNEITNIPNRSLSSLEIEARATALKWFSENMGREGVTPTFREAALERRKK